MEKTKKLLLIDNYLSVDRHHERFVRFEEIFKRIENLQYEILHFEKLKNIDTSGFDLIILTGSTISLSEKENVEKFLDEIELVKNLKKPILGICFGHQLIGKTFGFNVKKMKDENAEWDKKEVTLTVKPFELCHKEEIQVEEYHKEEIEHTPEMEKVFEVLASSEICKVQIIKHKAEKIYGVQFHPETEPNSKIKEDGEEILKRFLRLA